MSDMDSDTAKFRRFIREMNNNTQLVNHINNEEDYLELLLSKSVDEVNNSLRILLSKTLDQFKSSNNIKHDNLYVVFYPKRAGQIQYILGYDILSPRIEIPTVSQFKKAYQWYRIMNLEKDELYQSVDDFVKARILQSLEALRYLQNISSCEISPWEFIFLSSEGERTHLDLIKSAHQDFLEIRITMQFLKKHNAPHFMQEESRLNLQRLGVAIKCLTKNIDF